MTHNPWKPPPPHGTLSSQARDQLPDSAFAFPTRRKEPLTDAAHVRNALSRFNQVEGVTDAERDAAFENIKAAARHFGVDMAQTSWKELGKNSQRDAP